jgi:hypothetical protein
VKGDYPSFVADATMGCGLNNLVWHSSHLNLSVQTRIRGTVDLGTDAKKVGLKPVFDSHVFRNYTFIKDGRVNIKTFFVTTSLKTYQALKNKGLVVNDTYASDKTFGLDIAKLPGINRKIATGRTSATDLCRDVMREQRLKAEVKALKFFLKAEDEAAITSYDDAQIAFLTSKGIDASKGGLYAPPVEKGEASDQYMAKTFDIKIDKLNTLPSVQKVLDKITAGKARTPVEELVEAGITKAKNKDAAWLESTVKGLQHEMRRIRNDIQQTKFAVILGKKWFDEFTSRDNPSHVVDGITFKFELGEEAVEI